MAEASPQGKLIEFNGASLAVMTASLRDTDPVRLADALHMMLGGMPDFFAGEPAVLDFAQLGNPPERVDWTAILSLLRRYQLQPMGVRNLAEHLHDGARRAGLALLGARDLSAESPQTVPQPQAQQTPAPAPTPEPAPVEAAVAEVLGTFSVVVLVMRMRSIEIPSASATTCATLVFRPCPISVPPWFRWTEPSE